MLDARLSLVFDLYPACKLGADIGTDHGYLPCALLESGKADHMILTDISVSALSNATAETVRRRLSSRVTLLTGDGLSPIEDPCEVISITGMGGRTIRQILLEGREKLHAATLILSAHTDLPLLRSTLGEIGYTLRAEKICKAAGRFYLVLMATPGKERLTAQEIRLGSLLFTSDDSCLPQYLEHRKAVLSKKLKGLLSVSSDDHHPEIKELREDIDYLERFLSDSQKGETSNDCQ